MLIEMSDSLIPVRRPHLELRERQLFFMLSSRPSAEFDAIDEALWESIDGLRSVGQLRVGCLDADLRLQRLWDLGACELVQHEFPRARRRVLVLEPHMDDAALSVGGLMWALRNQCEFTLVSIAGYSNFTSYYFLDREYFDVEKISALRKAESELVMRLLGGRHTMLNESDTPLRYQPGNWTLDWYRRNRRCVNARLDHCASAEEIATCAEAISRVLKETDAEEIWLPLGVGGHADHELSRNACLRALEQHGGIEQRVSLYFYQDVPYATQFPDHTGQILDALRSAGGILVDQRADISGALDGKLRLNAIYGSQFKLSYIAPKIEKSARAASASGTGFSEVLFHVDRLPGPVEPLALYSGRAAVDALAARLGTWYRRHRLARRIRILSLVGVGRWAEDMQVLLEAFPQADFEVYLSAATAGETERFVSPRITVRIVEGRSSAWGLSLLGIALSKPCPLIVMTGTSRQRLMSLIRVVCFLSNPLSAVTTNYLVLALGVVNARRA
ncbi:MAG: hypothetical protein EG825_03415 [Rhodocyclaceae bacterium]|nr:hypothetical protein [Rhodocyclaceae bacterium]